MGFLRIPEGVRGYVERRSLFVAKRLHNQEKSNKKRFFNQINSFCKLKSSYNQCCYRLFAVWTFLTSPFFVKRRRKMYKLQERAISFRNLLDYEYNIILGRNNTKTEITINFEKSDFSHLIGLHKLKDVLNGNLATEKLFDKCLTGKISFDRISKSSFFSKLGNRFEYFINIEKMLDSNKTVFKCNTRNMAKFSKIIADFELKNIYDDLVFYLFIERRNSSEKLYCKSFIQESNIDYTYGQTKMTLLYKEKINKKTNERVIQYDRLS